MVAICVGDAASYLLDHGQMNLSDTALEVTVKNDPAIHNKRLEKYLLILWQGKGAFTRISW